jgi:hypothetical protein
MTSIDLLSPVLFYQNPIDIYQTINGSTQMQGVPNEINSCRGCYNTLNSNDPASQYQKQKIIQNTVRVQSSLYTMNLAGLAGYKNPLKKGQMVEQAGSFYYVPPNTYWNQQSDRPSPSQQQTKVADGSTYHSSSTKHSITRLRPGSMSPGGLGVDIKHNSYDRYLNKIKGKGPLRRGPIPSTYGLPVPFTCAYPIYGDKRIKTNIISGCNCPEESITNTNDENYIYGNPESAIQEEIFNVTYTFNIGDTVWVQQHIGDKQYYQAKIIEITDNNYLVQFVNDNTTLWTTTENMLVYYDCSSCSSNINSLWDQALLSDLPVFCNLGEIYIEKEIL